MSPSHVLEPTYRKLKEQLMAGHWPPGTRLEAIRIADDFGISMTPVRDSLNRLVGERIVDLRPGEGFSAARLSERVLRDMFEFNAALLVFAIVVRAPVANHQPAFETQAGLEYPEQIAAFFESVARGAGNSALTDAVNSLNDRLHATRRLDPAVIDGALEEFGEIVSALVGGEDRDLLRARLVAYHERRKHAAAQFLELLEQGN